jgi:hypothetical protein
MMGLLEAVGFGFGVAWIGFPLLGWLARRADVPAERCRRMRAALLSTTAIPVLATMALLWPTGAHVELARAVVVPLVAPPEVVPFSMPPARWLFEPLAWLGALWMGLVLWGGSCELERWLGFRELRRRAKPAPTGMQAQAVCVAGELEMRAPTVLLSDHLKWAGAAGVFEPVVILPRDYVGLSNEDLLLVLRHEILHLKRRDPVWGVAERWCAALLGWHPWQRRFRADLHLAREAAVDSEAGARDLAGYARLLVDLAERSMPEGDLAWVPMAGASLEKRIHMILDPVSSQPARLIPLVAGIGTLGALAMAGSAAVAEPLGHNVTFIADDSRPGAGLVRFTRPLPPPEELEPRSKADIDACYESARASDPNLVVDTVAQLELDKTGQVVRASIPSSSSAFQTCIEERALGWHFPPPPGAPPPPENAKLFVGFPIRRGVGD